MIVPNRFGSAILGLPAFVFIALAFSPTAVNYAQEAAPADVLPGAEAGLQRAIQASDLAEALRLAREAVASSERSHGRNHVNTATRLVDLGTLLHAAGDNVAAGERYLEAETVYTVLFGPLSPQHVDLQLRLAALHPPQATARRQHALGAIQTQQSLTPEDRLAQAQIAFRAGALLAEQVHGNPEAERILEEALRTYESHYGTDAEALVPLLSSLADASARHHDASNQLRHYDRALRIVQRHHGNDSEAYADLALRAARHSLLLSITDTGRRQLRNAQAIYGRVLGPDHPKTATSQLVQGEFETARQRYRNAEAPLLQAARVFSALPEQEANLVRTLTLLVTSFEQQGKSEAATPHLLQLARYQPPVPVQDWQPIFRATPRYPPSAVSRGEEGYVVMEFTIDETGRVRDPAIYISGGSEAFHAAALDALQKFRYLPRFEAGAAVVTPGVRHMFTFSLRD